MPCQVRLGSAQYYTEGGTGEMGSLLTSSGANSGQQKCQDLFLVREDARVVEALT